MANEYFTASGNPATRATATSASMRAEFAAIVAGFDKLPTMTGNGGKLLVVNSAGTALTASSTIYESSGNVSIGTTALASKVTVKQSALSLGLTLESSADQSRLHTYTNGSVWFIDATVGASGTYQPLAIRTNGAERMRIDASGNVGIGLTSPTNKLDVNGTVGFWASGTQIGSAFNDSLALNLQANNNATSGLKLGTSGSTPIVAYTNGSERMRIDASGNVLLGTNTAGYSAANRTTLEVNGATDAVIALRRAGANKAYWQAVSDDGTVIANATATGYLAFNTNATERMRIDASGNVGIGTSSPASKLHVVGDIQQENAGYLKGKLAAGTTTRLFGLNASNTLYVGSIDADHTGGTLFVKNGSTQATLDANGNLGLGVAPSTWTSYKAIEASARGNALYSVSSEIGLTSNAYFNAGWKYAAGAIAPTRYASGSGAHVWYTASSGSVDAAFTWTTAMTLDASGNLLLGATTAVSSERLRVESTSAGAIATTLRISNLGTTSGTGESLYFTGYTNAAAATNHAAIQAVASDTSGNAYMSFLTGTSGSVTEKVRIDATGRLLHGTTSASVTNGGFLWVPGADSIGYIGHASGSASGNGFFAFQLAGVQIGSITQNGTTAVAYNTSSDYRLKDITGPVTGSGEYIDALNPVVGSWKADGAPFVGLIAHEVQDISSTQVATGVKDGEVMQSMDYSAPEIMANIIAELKSLRARVANLEAA